MHTSILYNTYYIPYTKNILYVKNISYSLKEYMIYKISYVIKKYRINPPTPLGGHWHLRSQVGPRGCPAAQAAQQDTPKSSKKLLRGPQRAAMSPKWPPSASNSVTKESKASSQRCSKPNWCCGGRWTGRSPFK